MWYHSTFISVQGRIKMNFLKSSLFLVGLFGLCIGDGSYNQDIDTNTVHGNYHSAPYPAAHPTYPSASPAPQYQSSPNGKWEEPESYSLQSGYEGYLIPSEPSFSFSDLLRTAGILTILPPLSKIGLKLGWKLGLWGLGFLSLFIVGSIVTTAVCSFTPLCTISFIGLRGFDKESVRSFITEDKINMATKFLHDAIEKYRDMNKKKSGSSRK